MSKLEKISRNWLSIYEKISDEESIKDKLQNEISDLDYQISLIYRDLFFEILFKFLFEICFNCL